MAEARPVLNAQLALRNFGVALSSAVARLQSVSGSASPPQAPVPRQTPPVPSGEGDGDEEPFLAIEDVRQWLAGAANVLERIRHFGLPATSWRNKMPYWHPRASYLARGLKWPEEHQFQSEQERRHFLRRSRRRRKFMLGRPPTWSFMAANVALIWFLVVNPKFPWSRDF